MAQPNASPAPEKPTAPAAAVKPAPEKPTAPPAPLDLEDEDDEIPAGAEAFAAAAAAGPSLEDRIVQGFDRVAEKMNPTLVDRSIVRAVKAQPQGVAPEVPILGHAIVTDEFRTFRRMIPTAHIMHPSGSVIEVGGSGRPVPTGLNYDNVKSGAWKVECFSPHPDELLTVGDGERARKFVPNFPFDEKKYKNVNGVMWHPVYAPAAKK